MFVVCVHVHVKPDCHDAFVEASQKNSVATVGEPGALRFDVLQQQDDPNRFVLYEVYVDEDSAGRHKETAHYAAWRDTVAEMMAEPRSGVRYTSHFPIEADRWRA